jgi:hypothetical protein|tara:strand:+ start:547 stop:717 length:171 start_codon:yes stop_codon:yes gene_type:complete
MRHRLETMEEFLKRGGKVIKFPEEIAWNIIPVEERNILKSAVETLDYERDHRPKWR